MYLSTLDKVLRMQGDMFSSQVQRGVLIDSCLELTDTVLGTYPIEGLHGHHPTTVNGWTVVRRNMVFGSRWCLSTNLSLHV